MYGHHICQSMDQPGEVANPARDQLNPFAPENLVSRDGRPVPRQPVRSPHSVESINMILYP